MKWLTVSEWAQKHDVSPDRARKLVKRMPGARCILRTDKLCRNNHYWLIPETEPDPRQLDDLGLPLSGRRKGWSPTSKLLEHLNNIGQDIVE